MNSILLVDDEVAVCSELQRTLRRFGYQVEAAHTSESALRRARQRHFDLMLVEFNLRSKSGSYPRTGNGLRFVSQIRASRTIARVLMFTVMEGELYETTSLKAGADGFVSKVAPISSLFTWLDYQLQNVAKDVSSSLA